MLSIRVRNWSVCSACASGPDAYAQHTLQFLTRMLSMVGRDPLQIWNFYAYAEHTRQELVRMLSLRVRPWCACSAYAPVPDAYAQHTLQFLTRMLSMRIMVCEINFRCVKFCCICMYILFRLMFCISSMLLMLNYHIFVPVFVVFHYFIVYLYLLLYSYFLHLFYVLIILLLFYFVDNFKKIAFEK